MVQNKIDVNCLKWQKHSQIVDNGKVIEGQEGKAGAQGTQYLILNDGIQRTKVQQSTAKARHKGNLERESPGVV